MSLKVTFMYTKWYCNNLFFPKVQCNVCLDKTSWTEFCTFMKIQSKSWLRIKSTQALLKNIFNLHRLTYWIHKIQLTGSWHTHRMKIKSNFLILRFYVKSILADLQSQKLSQLISRIIWVSENFLKFHTVRHLLLTRCCVGLRPTFARLRHDYQTKVWLLFVFQNSILLFTILITNSIMYKN